MAGRGRGRLREAGLCPPAPPLRDGILELSAGLWYNERIQHTEAHNSLAGVPALEMDMRMSPDSKCRHCGNCCRHCIPVLPEELQQIADYLGISEPSSLIDPDFRDPALAFLAKDDADRCRLQTDDGLCSVHEVKPQVCRSWACESRVAPKVQCA